MNKEKIVKKVDDICNAVNDMNEAMRKTPEKEQEKICKLTEFKKKFPDALYLEPEIRIPTQGNRHPEEEKKRDYLTEYVVGVFESQIISGKLKFYLTGLPGDDYCRWSIPVNKPVGIPRFVAKHLANNLAWKEVKPLSSRQEVPAYHDDEMTIPFQQFEYKKRGHFRAINEF